MDVPGRRLRGFAVSEVPVAPPGDTQTSQTLVARKLGHARRRRRVVIGIVYALIVALAIGLRLHGIHNPILDHPGWRQGDTAAIARNFATLQFNPLYPQVDYNGPPPNYVELELQIVPFLAAIGYKLFGVHEIFGRLISLAFGVGTVVVVGAFGRRLFRSDFAGIAAAAIYAVLPGSVYYSRTFMPDTTMVFFLTCAIYAWYRYVEDEPSSSWRGLWPAAILAALAFLAKPVALSALVPIAAVSMARYGWRGTLARPQTYAFLAIALVPLAMYGRIVAAHAEWHWASGITRKHVIPSLGAALTNGGAFVRKALAFAHVLRMLATTMLGPFGAVLLAGGFCVPYRNREGVLLWSWLAAGAAYIYVVVTVERVDYYMYPVLPLAALVGAAGIERIWLWVRSRRFWQFSAAAGLLAFGLMTRTDQHILRPYYVFDKTNYRAAKALDATLAPHALVVMAHYDPSILYYINRKGWEEDPYLWTPFDEQSAIRKGARYFIAIEKNRFRRNIELYNWMQRFPVMNPDARWPVYQTDYAKVLPGAEERWQEFRRREKAGLLPKMQLPTVPGGSGTLKDL